MAYETLDCCEQCSAASTRKFYDVPMNLSRPAKWRWKGAGPGCDGSIAAVRAPPMRFWGLLGVKLGRRTILRKSGGNALERSENRALPRISRWPVVRKSPGDDIDRYAPPLPIPIQAYSLARRLDWTSP